MTTAAVSPPVGAPLSGVTVLDFSRVLAGPHCTRMLADLGADVIKVEPPGGDMTRSFPPRVADTMSLYFMSQNCGKRNISIDLDQESGVELALQLAERCDVMVENFRPGVMRDFGLGYDAVRERNPGIVYASISGYGHDNPWEHRKAFAPIIHAEAGLTHLRARRHGEDRPFEVTSHADVYVALECLSGILAALYQRGSTGTGQHVDVDMASTLLCVNDRAAGEVGFDMENRHDREACVLATTAGGRQVVIMGEPTTKFVAAAYAAAMGTPELLDDARFATVEARRRHRDELVAIVQAWVADFDDVEKLDAVLAAHRIPMGMVRTIPELADSEWAAARGAFADVDNRVGGTSRIPQSPWRFSDASTGAGTSISYPGEDNAQVLHELLGLDDDEIDELTRTGALRSRLPSP